jgi:DNA-binding response OmpR family regulator
MGADALLDFSGSDRPRSRGLRALLGTIAGNRALRMSANPPVILFAEDDRHIRETTADLLDLFGMRVHAVPSGRTAREVLARERIDLVITDLIMPDGDGAWLLEYVRKTFTDHPLPVIMLTARTGTAEETAPGGARADHYLSKPFEPERLLEVVRRSLGPAAGPHAAARPASPLR